MLVVDRLALPDTTVQQDDGRGDKIPNHKIDEKKPGIPVRRAQTRSQSFSALSVVGEGEPPVDSPFDAYREQDGAKEHVRHRERDDGQGENRGLPFEPVPGKHEALETVIIPAFDILWSPSERSYLRRIVSRFIGARVSTPNFL